MPTPNIDHSLQQLKDVLAVAHDEELTPAQQAILEKYRGDAQLPPGEGGGSSAYVGKLTFGATPSSATIEHLFNPFGSDPTMAVGGEHSGGSGFRRITVTFPTAMPDDSVLVIGGANNLVFFGQPEGLTAQRLGSWGIIAGAATLDLHDTASYAGSILTFAVLFGHGSGGGTTSFTSYVATVSGDADFIDLTVLDNAVGVTSVTRPTSQVIRVEATAGSFPAGRVFASALVDNATTDGVYSVHGSRESDEIIDFVVSGANLADVWLANIEIRVYP